jgi:hypothetical protein
VTDPDRLSRIRATVSRCHTRGLCDATDAAYLIRQVDYLLGLVDEFMPKQRELFGFSEVLNSPVKQDSSRA